MTDPYSAIVNFLNQSKVSYQTFEHEPVFTSAQASAIRGIPQSSGMKSLLLKTKGNFVLAVLPGDQKLDNKKFKQLVSVSEFRFATPEEVEEVMGCQVGACYPFGNLINVPMFVDSSFKPGDLVAFNPGRHDLSFVMPFADYLRAVNPKIVNII